jgi:hypothetical protein
MIKAFLLEVACGLLLALAVIGVWTWILRAAR